MPKKRTALAVTDTTPKRSRKEQRAIEVLIGLVDLYVKEGKPIGSNTLREHGFEHLSSATIRNYFASLEEQGYLAQLHSSGGRAPTHKAYRLYVQHYIDQAKVAQRHVKAMADLERSETREIASYMQEAAEHLSQTTGLALFLSAPRFDHDFVQDIRLLAIDTVRYLCVLITDFGLVHTEMLRTEMPLGVEHLEEMEHYFRCRFVGLEEEVRLPQEVLEIANRFYNEVMVRYIVSYSTFMEEDIYRTGFSQLLQYPEFNDVAPLASSLSLFENPKGIRLLLRECAKAQKLKCWVGDDLAPYTPTAEPDCAVLAVPYRIHQNVAGAVGLLGPTRMPYHELFCLLKAFSEVLSETLTRSVYHYRIQYRMPEEETQFLEAQEQRLVEDATPILLEDQTKAGKKKST